MIPWKLAEAAFSRLWLLLIPIVIAPIVATAMMQEEPQYWSSSTVWVSRPENVDPGVLLSTAQPWETPAQAQAQVLRDLLGTESFRAAVAERAGIEGADAPRIVAESVVIGAPGTNIVSVTATTADPRDSATMVDAVLKQYQERAAAAAEESASLQVSYFQTQVAAASDELAARELALNEYLADNPGAADPYRVDKEFLRMSSGVDSQQRVVEGLLAALLEAEGKAAAAPYAQEATFSVQDSPSSPQIIGTTLTKRLMYPVLALLFGAAISATYLYITYRLDHAVRTNHDLIDVQVPVLGFVPQVKGGKPAFLSNRVLNWISIGNNRDYARMVAASMSTGGSESYA